MVEAGRSAASVVADLAEAKGRSVLDEVGAGRWVLASDTVCVDEGGGLVGTPESPERALAMLRGFVNSDHAVVTGVALFDEAGALRSSWADRAVVRWGAIEEGVLAAYVAGGGWAGKAGGYNLFERQAAGWPIEVDGDPTTVVGLPMERLVVELRGYGLVGDAGGGGGGG